MGKNKKSDSEKGAAKEKPEVRDDAYWLKRAEEMGAKGAKIVAASSVLTANWVRWKCQFGCDCFGTNLMCPPYTPEPEDTRVMLDEYQRALLFEASGKSVKKIAFRLERELFLSGYYKAFGMGAGPCNICNRCALEKGCRHPDRARPAMESCGVDVFGTVRGHGFTLEVARTCEDPQHYFGLVLIE